MNNIQQALDNVNMTYAELSSISDDIIKRSTSDIEKLISYAERAESMPNEALRQLIYDFVVRSYRLGESCSHALLKSEIAEALTKERQANEYNTSEGTVDVRKNTALLNTSEEVCVNLIYASVSESLKRLLDEVHRIIDALKNILISRQAEAKLSYGVENTYVGEVTR